MEPLIVPGTLESLTAIAEYVMTAAAVAGLDKKTSYNLRLAVDEIATNTIIYGYGKATFPGCLNVQAHLEEECLKIFLEDSGDRFDPTQQSAPDNFCQPLERRLAGGLGIYLTMQSVDKFIYERFGELNRNIFVVNRKSCQMFS
ncbi:ATP-binding protein [Nostoc sp. PCC 7107]|uniref:ATP-binding protein n=1 Tax=Nostoc sp. PCC 7107 TaxID=317936 RepID=UPI00029ECF8D|nr:ATP-binding protein [Nostoc sp. PCC 7107]AFY43771.1 putative anti-sigma regulatory factor, serine/threonine protein kinase [Nostoc sp. PCC 7107]